MHSPFYSIDEARSRAQKRLPKIIFDYIDGAAGNELAKARNREAFQEIYLQARVLVNVDQRSLKTSFLGKSWGLPFGIAPMGLCNLAWPRADQMLAQASKAYNIPAALSTAGSTSIEDFGTQTGQNGWFQLYVGGAEVQAMGLVSRAEQAGYDTLVFTVDVPQVAPRRRDMRNQFVMPFKIGPKLFWDFATHPRWSITSLLAGAPRLANFPNANSKQDGWDRNSGRGKIDFPFLARLREKWPHKLIVKGVTHADDAKRIQAAGADAIWVSNHGGRQLASSLPAIHILPKVRAAVGNDYPLMFDSGIRNGEDAVKALALGADFIMLGRPFLWGVAAGAQDGLNNVIDLMANEISVAMAQVGKVCIEEIDSDILVKSMK
ncbi:MAG: alpha-hydroxy acid oxidase [Chloroflexota bacterium]